MTSAKRLSFPALLLVAGVAQAAPPRTHVEGEVIVKFRQGTSSVRMQAVARSVNPKAALVRPALDPITGDRNPHIGLYRFPKTTAAQTVISRLRLIPDVERVELNYFVSAGLPALHRPTATRTAVNRRVGRGPNGTANTRSVASADQRALVATYPNDPYALDPVNGWNWLFISADVVWPDAKAAEVAVIDSGVDTQHPDLMGRVSNGFDYVNGDSVANDDNGHGTHVAGIIAAKVNNKTGIAGVSRAKIYAVKVLDATGLGTSWDLAQGIRKAADRASVKVINISLGSPSFSFLVFDELDYAVNVKGKLVVAAAGNSDGSFVTDPFYPAAHSLDFPEKVMAVAASGTWVVPSSIEDPDPARDAVLVEDCRADYSYYSEFVNITAPGTDIYSTQPWKKDFYLHRYFGADPDLTGYEYLSGTSMAAPHVAAVAARLIATTPTLTNVQAFRRMLFQGYESKIGLPIDVDDDGTPEILECWESGFPSATPVGGPPFLADVDAALALGRSRVTGQVLDAYTGLGLSGATAKVLKSTGSAVLGFGGEVEGAGTSGFDIINVPWNDQTGTGPVAAPYRLRVTKSGYTGSATVEDYAAGDASKPGFTIPFLSVENLVRAVGIPPSGPNTTIVMDWGEWISGVYAINSELDQYLFRPLNLADPGDFGCAIGFFDIVGADQCGLNGSIGSLVGDPFARFLRDGSPLQDAQGTETTSIKKFLKTAAGNEYRLFVEDAALFDGTGFLASDALPVIRVWKGGALKATVRFAPGLGTGNTNVDPACLAAGGTEVCNWWNVGSMTSTGVFTPINALGDDSAWPYIPNQGGGPAPNGTSRTGRPRPPARR